MSLETAVLSIIALAAGAVVGWLWASARKSAESHRFQAERDMARAERERSERTAAEARGRLEAAQQTSAVAETRLAETQRLLADQTRFLGESRKQMEDAFAALAQRTLATVAESLVQTNKTQLDGSKGEIVQSLDTKRAEIESLLTPLREMLNQYRGELVKSEEARNQTYGGLQEQIKQLLSVQEGAQREASRLANALQSPTVRGSWGESSLKRCIELAGMSELCDFTMQETFTNDEGRRMRPDCIVHLPNKRVIAIDAKAPLLEYAAATEATDEARRQEFLTQHAKTLRRHIESLSRKDYQAGVGESLDFTVMFVPGEHFLSAALVTDPSLFEFAVNRKIYLASPTILLPLLRAIEAGWKAERTEETAKRMHEVSIELFNRFVTAMEKIAAVGKALQASVARYNEAIRSIDARLWPKGEELQRMAGSGKDLGELAQIEEMPIESGKLRLTMQGESEEEDPQQSLILPMRE
ncbi:MAG TPA: DNA recombination protein RmuC [Thermoanaerobaculia bacterium]|nr:DNA recombination protein RmuC [Thermoanaerobaculia bacterium]